MTTTAIDQSFLEMQQDIIGRNLVTIENFFSQVPGLQNSVIAVGKAAIAVKETLPHGQFGKWIAEHFPGYHSRINACMRFATQVAEGKLGTVPNIHDINAVKLLTSAKTSDDIREKVAQGEVAPTREAIKEARAGKKTSAEKLFEACIAFRADYQTRGERLEALYDAIDQLDDDDLLRAAPAMKELGAELLEVFG